jgi:hypothetical protein
LHRLPHVNILTFFLVKVNTVIIYCFFKVIYYQEFEPINDNVKAIVNYFFSISYNSGSIYYIPIMENVYHILYKKPALEKWQMPYELEDLAKQLVYSGRFRIDAAEKVNFVRFSRPADNINMVFSYRELCDAHLVERTTAIIQNSLSRRFKGAKLLEKTKSEFDRLHHDVTKIVGVDAKTEMKLARAIVQATDPCVMQLLLLEGAELFISYAHTVGDMLDIQSWQAVGDSSGLQSTGYRESSVFVSCGGNPFLPEDKKEFSGDGFNALARMLVIGGQELGHFSDIIRNKRGQKVSRHSADLSGMRAKEHTRQARINDIKYSTEIKKFLDSINLHQVSELERHLKFFKEHKRRGLVVMNTMRQANNGVRRILKKCNKAGLDFLTVVHRDDHKHLACQIEMMTGDMLANLTPKADAYMRPDPVEEEAIACIEALARVPQQVNKWGHLVTSNMMPDLYKIYYEEVLPACKETYEHMTGHKYQFILTNKGFFRKNWERFISRGV